MVKYTNNDIFVGSILESNKYGPFEILEINEDQIINGIRKNTMH